MTGEKSSAADTDTNIPYRDITLALCACVSPFVWVWTTEIAFVSHEMHDIIFFVWAVSGVLGYHLTMYFMFLSIFLLSFRVLQLSISTFN